MTNDCYCLAAIYVTSNWQQSPASLSSSTRAMQAVGSLSLGWITLSPHCHYPHNYHHHHHHHHFPITTTQSPPPPSYLHDIGVSTDHGHGEHPQWDHGREVEGSNPSTDTKRGPVGQSIVHDSIQYSAVFCPVYCLQFAMFAVPFAICSV